VFHAAARCGAASVALLALGVIVAVPAWGAGPVGVDPVALVEDVTGKPPGVAFLDYLPLGKVVQLGAGDRLVIGYLRSCVRETITGGTVTVGAEESAVVGGAVKREKVQCDGGKLRLNADQAAKSGVVVFRKGPGKDALKAGTADKVDQTIYGASPLVELPGVGRIVVERIDQPGERIELDVGKAQLLRGKFYDFAKSGRALAAGGVYRVEAGGRSVVIKVDPGAVAGAGPLAGRLIRL
jgi:hypothetical protein